MKKVNCVCVVANSPNVLEEELGKKIDSCDIVIRMTTFKVDGFEKYVGSKTHIAAFTWLPNRMALQLDSGVLMMKDIEFWSTRPLGAQRAQCCYDVLGHVNVKQPSNDVWSGLIKKIYQNFWRKQPGSGLVALQMAIEQFPDSMIYFCGFDPTIEKAHYCTDKIDRLENGKVGHHWLGEWEYIKELETANIITHVRDKV